MYTIRQIQQVKDRTITVNLPEEFPPTDSVEVIILPVQQPESEEASTVIYRFLNLDTAHFTADQRQAYDQACATVRQGRRLDQPRILGLFKGLLQVADDFDAPLPQEELFWGKDTDEYGLSQEK